MSRHLPLALVLLLGACGGDDGGEVAGDGPSIDAASVDGAPTCTRTGITTTTQLAERDDALELLFYTGLTAGDPFDRLTADFYFSLGATDGPHELALTGEDLADCGTCVLVYQGCSGTSCELATTYLAEAGTLRVTALGGPGTPFAATLEGARFAEVVIDRATQHATRVPDGDTWCLDAHAMGASITAP